jgi:Domain of Unknown Function (DUF1080)
MKKDMQTGKLTGLILSFLVAHALFAQPAETGNTDHWKIHDMRRPKPEVIKPADQNLPVSAPANAVVLFNGTDFSHWVGTNNSSAKWKLEKDYMEIVPGTGAISTTDNFGDIFLHIEWASPDEPNRKGQDRGNSGIFFMGMYELQVLDSYQADTYADGQAGALYGQAPPRFNVCRPRGEWNSYDIAFRRPRFASNGKLLTNARITVRQNGILIQDNEEFWGPTSWLKFLPYKAHADKLPISLQEHNGRVKFRNIWAIPMPELPVPETSYGVKTIKLADADLTKFTGAYDRPNSKAPILISKKSGKLYGDFFYRPGALELMPLTDHSFELKETDAQVIFEIDNAGKVKGLIFHIGDDDMPATKSK